MNNLTDDQQKISDELINLVMQRVFTKIAPNLADEDIAKIEELNRTDESGETSRNYLLSKVPNFDELFQKEVDLLKNTLENNSPAVRRQ